MAKISVVCPKCQTSYRIDENYEGRKGRCKKCGQAFVVTRQDSEGSTSSPKASPTAAPKPSASERELGEDGVPKVWQSGDVILDLYEITSVLGEGGMGTVFKAHHKGWNRELAVKSPKPEIFTTTSGMDNFVREAETWIDLGLHPHTVSCFYVRTLGGIPRVFAEYVNGGSLKDWINDGRLYDGGTNKSLERILDIAIQFAWGLHYAHENGLIHQDVKPANLMMTDAGVAKVTDFGLAKARAAAGNSIRSREASILVTSGGHTPAYCSPEQASGEKLSRTTDAWSWAVSVLEMFVGDVTWSSGTVAREALEEYLESGPQDKTLPEMPKSVAKVLASCLEQTPKNRPTAMSELAAPLSAAFFDCSGREYDRPCPKPAELLADGLNNRALSLLDLGRQSDAEAVLEQALEFDGHHPEATFNRGVLLWRDGRILDDELLWQMHEVLESHQTEWIDKYLLSLVHIERGNPTQAIPLLRECGRVAPDHPEVQAALSHAQHPELRIERSPRKYEGHTSLVRSVAFSPDKQLMASGSYDKTLRIWETASGRCLQTLKGHSHYVTSVAFSHDGTVVVSGSADESIQLWEVASGRCLRKFTCDAGPVGLAAFSSDDALVLAGYRRGLSVWEVSTGRCTRKLDAGRPMALSNDLRFAATEQGTAVKVWDLSSGACKQTLECHTDAATTAAISSDCRFVLSAYPGGVIRLWEMSTGRCLRILNGHWSATECVVFSHDGAFALAAGLQGVHGRVRVWELSRGRCLRTFEKTRSTCFALSPDGRLALASDMNDPILLELSLQLTPQPFAFSQPELSGVLADRAAAVTRYKKDAEKLLASGEAAQAYNLVCKAQLQPGYRQATELVDLRARAGKFGRPSAIDNAWHLQTFTSEPNENPSIANDVRSVAFSPDGRLALLGRSGLRSKNRLRDALTLWDLLTGECLRKFEGLEHGVESLAFSADGSLAFSAGEEMALEVWNMSDGRCVHRLRTRADKRGVGRIAFSPDREFVLSAGRHERKMQLWEVASGKCLRTFEVEHDSVTCIDFSPDGRLAITGSSSKWLRLWEVSTGRCLARLEGEAGTYSIAFSPDGRMALSGGDSTCLWDIPTCRRRRTLLGHTSRVYALAFSPDAKFALSASADQTIRLWDLASGECLRTLVGHENIVQCVTFSPDGQLALSGSMDETARLWQLAWRHDFPGPAAWDDEARPHLQNFLTLRSPTKRWLRKRKPPTWTEKEFKQLIIAFRHAGYGWLHPEGVRQKLEEMAAEWKGPPPLPGTE